VVRTVNEKFVSTWVPYPVLMELVKKGDPLARLVAEHWEYPVEFIFFSPEGKFLTRLNSGKDFPDRFPGVTKPEYVHKPQGVRLPTHVEVFMNHLTAHFGSN